MRKAPPFNLGSQFSGLGGAFKILDTSQTLCFNFCDFRVDNTNFKLEDPSSVPSVDRLEGRV